MYFNGQLIHTGVAHDDNPPGRGSGRYEFGSGANPYQHGHSFLTEVNRLRNLGYADKDIAKMLLGTKGYNKKTGEPIWCNTTDLRARISIENTNERRAMVYKVKEVYYGEGNGSPTKTGRILGINESSVRSYLKQTLEEKNDKYQNTAKMLKEEIAKKGMIDVSSGQELYLGCTDHTKNVAVAILCEQGYVKSYVKLPQMNGSGKETTMIVLAPPPKEGETERDVRRAIQQNKYNIATIANYSPDKGTSWWTPEYPEMLDSKRVMIRYAEDGGKEKDGVIELRRGVEDISLGNAQYAQVRIGVDGTNYLKGMAMYGLDEDFPDGIDVIFNTNKHRGTPLIDPTATYNPTDKSWSGHEVSKRLKMNADGTDVDRENPFGALIKSEKEKDGIILTGGQRHYVGEDGQDHLSPINKLREEGDWDSWSRTLASQFLAKQPIKLIKQQLDLSILDKEEEYEKISNLTNPVIKKKLLNEYADNCDANASDLSAKGVKNQAFQVLLPVPGLKDNEIYAPNYDDGDTVALVRYPHGGIFEIPVLKVNNRAELAKKVMKNARDAVGINSKVAEQLSGADYDGDTAIVIPVKSNRLGILSTPYLEDLKSFDPKEIYKLPDSAPPVKNDTKQLEMGKVTNLITDMTVGGADLSQIAKAVKHSMVVIDSEKHHLDYKQSYKDFDIENLKKDFQGETPKGQAKGASTILSRASAETYVPRRKEITDTKKMTPEELESWNAGNKVYRNTGETAMKLIKDPSKMTEDELQRYNAGKKVFRETDKLKTIKITQMANVNDAMELVRDPDNEKEVAYANYANSLKNLARQARIEARNINAVPVSKEAAKTYAEEVSSLKSKLAIAEMNRPLERKALGIANAIVAERLKANPDMDFEHQRRESALAMTKARAMVGAKKQLVNINDKEWEAIQSNAVSTNVLQRILDNTDQEAFRKRATPRNSKSLTNVQIQKALAMSASGMYTNKEIADSLGVSASTISAILAGERS